MTEPIKVGALIILLSLKKRARACLILFTTTFITTTFTWYNYSTLLFITDEKVRQELIFLIYQWADLFNLISKVLFMGFQSNQYFIPF